ncbi:MAG: DUF1540 domain-containing protein [Clostridiales bacterium]|nr:DUF1540 domain-containing protein [Clostridiales bacterium]
MTASHFLIFCMFFHLKTFSSRNICPHKIPPTCPYCFHHRKGRWKMMSFQNKNQCIHCSVESCRHHSQNGLCELESIQVKPRSQCESGNCDESLCASYHAK